MEPKSKISVGIANFREVRSPEAIEKKYKGIVWWGADNLYPQNLVAWRQDNPIHGGIINQKVTFMSAAGADITGPPDIVDYLSQLLPEIVDDFETFNGFSVLFKRKKGIATTGAEEIPDTWCIEHIDFESVRFKITENVYAISDDWSHLKQTAEKTNYKEILDISCAPYSEDNEFLLYARVKPKQRKLHYVRGAGKNNSLLSLCYYPVPAYSGATTSILAGIEQDYFTYAESVNGYKGGTVISLNNGQPGTDQEANKIANDIKEEATDRDRQGGIVVLFADGKDNAATVTSMNGNDLDKRYLESNKEIRDKILTGHSVGSPTLFGIKSEAAFGSKEEMETAYTLFTNNYVTKRQKFISDAIIYGFKRILIDITIEFKKYTLSLAQEESADNVTLRRLNDLTPAIAAEVLKNMSSDEIRDLVKLLPKQPTAQMSSEAMTAVTNAMLLLKFKSLGVKRSKIKVVKSRAFDYKATDEDFLAELAKFDGLTDIQIKILQMISEEKTFNEISKAIGKGSLALSLEILKLRAGGYLKGWKVQDKKNPSVEVMYSYEVKPDLGPAVIPTTREFCRDLIVLDRLYTRAEIDTMTDEFGLDVWRYRGGWYHNPKTDKTTRSCRHEWKQNIVSK